MLQAFSAGPEKNRQLASYVESVGNNTGHRLLSEQRIDEAVAIFKATVEAFPTSTNAHDSYAESLLAAGDTTGAIEWYTKALEIDPDFGSAKRMLARLDL